MSDPTPLPTTTEPVTPPATEATPASQAAADAPAPAPAPASAPAAAPMSPAECAQQLKQRFPALFGGAVKPLKLRIQVDIQERAPGVFSKQALSAFFRRHTGSTSYLIAVTKAPTRFDLDGQPAGEITDEHRKVAQDELARRRGNQEERRQLEEQQRRNRAGLLHDFQTTTLTKANFCALKGVPIEELDGLLEIARTEAQERARQLPPAFEQRQQRPPQRPRADGPDAGPRGPQRRHGGGNPPPRRPR
ncbi:ProQ/FINO family protein [Rhizobacter fulvus]